MGQARVQAVEADTGTPTAATRKPWSVQGADPSRYRWQAQPLARVRREAYAEASSLESRPACRRNADRSTKGQGKGQRFILPPSLVHQKRNPPGSLTKHGLQPGRGPAVHSSTLSWGHISSGEPRNSLTSTQQDTTTDHNTMGLPGCAAYTRRAAAGSSTAPAWD